MTISTKKFLPFFIIVDALIIAGLAYLYLNPQLSLSQKIFGTPVTENTAAQLANPASTNCIEKGGTLEIRENKKGQYGVCLFEDNRQCEERALLHGDCPVGGMKITGYENDAEIFCAITGGEVEGLGTDTPMCKRVDGTLCNAQANLDGDCPDPYDPNAGNVEAQ